MTQLLRALRGFPQFLFLHVLGLLIAVLGDFETFGLTVLGVLIALATTPVIGAASALGLYLVMRHTMHVVSAVITSR